MSNDVTVTFDDKALNKIRKKYGNDLTQRVIMISNKYMSEGGFVQREARKIIEDAGQVDTSRLLKSIKPSLKIYADRVTAEIKAEIDAETNYARFIHEGSKHSGNEIIPHYVPFAAAPGLLVWAERHGVIYRKTRKTAKRNSNVLSDNMRGRRSDKYYFYSKRTKKEYSIDIRKGGMMVYQRPLKFFEIPFEEYAPKYVKELEGLLK